jgi:formate dehydrogenase major subunit
MVSLLKAYWGDAATAENDFAFDYLPRIDGDHGHYQTVLDQIDGLCKGYFLVGRTPRWAPPTAACSASGWPTSSGWSCATW